jgi:hypothetical protein
MRSAFVDLVVVGIFAREQISLRSATLRDLLWEGQTEGERGRRETYSFASIVNCKGREGEGEVHVTRGCFPRRKWQDWIGSSSSLEP